MMTIDKLKDKAVRTLIHALLSDSSINEDNLYDHIVAISQSVTPENPKDILHVTLSDLSIASDYSEDEPFKYM